MLKMTSFYRWISCDEYWQRKNSDNLKILATTKYCRTVLRNTDSVWLPCQNFSVVRTVMVFRIFQLSGFFSCQNYSIVSIFSSHNFCIFRTSQNFPIFSYFQLPVFFNCQNFCNFGSYFELSEFFRSQYYDSYIHIIWLTCQDFFLF